MTIPTWRDWLFSVKALIASMMALFIALSLDLPRPYWAMAAVYVVANPLAGATSSKGLYRALGTLIGASAAVILVPILVDSPILLSLVICLWTGTLLFVSMLDRTPRSYVFMLAGYTLPMIGLAAVSSPESVFDTALARSEEIIIGITCASIVSAVLFPASVGGLLKQRINNWLNDAGDWADTILDGTGISPVTPLKRQKLATDVSSLDLILTQLSYDAGSRDIVRYARQLRGRMLMLLPLLSSLADRLHGLKAGGGELPTDLVVLLQEVRAWIKQGGKSSNDGTAERLSQAITDMIAQTGGFDWRHLLLQSALARTKEIVDLWHDCLTLRDRIGSGRKFGHRWRPAFRNRRIVMPKAHHDYGLLVFKAGTVVAGAFVASLFWIFTGWGSGASFVIMMAVACSFFAGMDQPAPMIKMMFTWTTVSVIVSFIYIFGILPAIDSYEMLVMVFAPPFLGLGLMITQPKYMLLGMLLAVNSATFIALQDRYTADFATFTNDSLGTVLGIGFALIWTLVARPFGAELAARRLVAAGWRDLAQTAAGMRRHEYEEMTARTLDRLGQLVPRLASTQDPVLAKVDGFAEVRLGFNVLMLQSRRQQLDVDARYAVDAVLNGVADLFKARLKAGSAINPSEELLGHIDAALDAVVPQMAQHQGDCLDALVGLRRVLFPDAEPPLERTREPLVPPHLSMAAE